MTEYTVYFQDHNGSRPDQNPPESMVVKAETPQQAAEIVDSKICRKGVIGYDAHPYIIRIYIQHKNGRTDCPFEQIKG